MKTLLLLAVVALSFTAACSGSRSDEGSAPAPASVKMDSSGVVVDTTKN